MAENTSQTGGALPADAGAAAAPSADASTLVNNWFAANPGATNDQAAAAVQAYGGLTPDLTSALAAHYGTDAGTITSAYNSYLNANQPAVNAPSGGTATDATTQAASTLPAAGAQAGATSTPAASSLPPSGGAATSVDTSATSAPVSNAAAPSNVDSFTAWYKANPSASGAQIGEAMSTFGLNADQARAITGVDEKTARENYLSTAQLVSQNQGLAPAIDAIQKGGKIQANTNPDDGSTYYTLNGVQVQNKGNGIYAFQTGNSTRGGTDTLAVAADASGNVAPVSNVNNNYFWTPGTSGSVVGQIMHGLGPLGSVAVSIGLNAILPGAGELGSYITGAAADSTAALTVGGATLGATTGATLAALTGQNITKGALTGAVTGGAASNATSLVNSVVNTSDISKSLNGIYTPDQVSSIIGNSFVRAVAAGVAGGDTSKIMSTFTTGLIANGLGTSAASKVADAFSGQFTPSTLNSIAKTVGNVTNAATTAALSGGDKNAVSTAIVASLAGSGAQALTSTDPTAKNLYNTLVNMMNNPQVPTAAGGTQIALNNTQANDYLNEMGQYLTSGTKEDNDKAQGLLNKAIDTEASDPNGRLQSLGNGSYFDSTSNQVFKKDSNGDYQAVDATLNKDGTVSYSQPSADGKTTETVTGTIQKSANPSTVVYNFADLNPDQKSQYLGNIMANKSDSTGTASFIPETSPGVWQLPFNVIGHTTDAEGKTGNEVYQDDSGNKFTLAVVNGTTQQVPFDESKVTWVPNKTPTAVTTNVDPNTAAPSKVNTVTDQTKQTQQTTDQTKQTQPSNVSSSASSASTSSGQPSSSSQDSSASKAASAASSSAAASSDSASTQAQKAQDAIKLLQSENVQPSDIAAYLQQVLGYSASDANNLLKARIGYNPSGASSSGASSSGASSSGASSSGASSSGSSSSGSSSSGTSGSGTSSSGTSGSGASGTSGSGTSGSGTSSSGSSSSGASSSGSSSSGSSGKSSSGSSSSGSSSSGSSSSGSSGSGSSGTSGTVSSGGNKSVSISGGSSGGSGGGTLPGNLLGTVLAGIPVAQREKIMKDLKQLYPQISHIDPKTLQTIQSGSKEETPETGALPGAIPGMPTAPQPGTTTGLTNSKLDNPLTEGNYSALTNAGLQLMSGNSGALPSFKKGGNVHVPEFITGATGHYVKGRGDGQSDDIPAMLADGEYVFDADTVAALGNGSSDAGAHVLDKMREAIRKHKRSAPVDKIPPKAKSPLEYLKGVK